MEFTITFTKQEIKLIASDVENITRDIKMNHSAIAQDLDRQIIIERSGLYNRLRETIGEW